MQALINKLSCWPLSPRSASSSIDSLCGPRQVASPFWASVNQGQGLWQWSGFFGDCVSQAPNLLALASVGLDLWG